MQPDSTIRVKSSEEIIAELTDIIHRHRRSFLRKNLRPCPKNCAYALFNRHNVASCPTCESRNPEVCNAATSFVPAATKEELAEQFRQNLRNTNILSHDYRDILVLLWVLGQLDGDQPDEEVIARAERHEV